MKKSISVGAIIIAACLLFLGTLITNRIQTGALQTADRLGPHLQPEKASFKTERMNTERSMEDTLRSIYSSSGGMLFLNIASFAVLGSTLLWVSTRENKT
ncbi:hypothetical protein DDZ13_15225 [Coraliomargarita sinensis]|uniref:Uncharacterized protein n=1 Tax=Coraliomargarita sinensis TaxID=2174842 RepID=A0A317ZGA8_9BACT|nr:hypothetical protein DDZ13_15225 [Coraliomargarita sinensis]